MLNSFLISSLLQEYREEQSQICWLQYSVVNASGRGKEYLTAELLGHILAQKNIRDLLDQCYIQGITTEQLLKDIQR